MAANVVTVEVFQAFRTKLLEEIKKLLSQKLAPNHREWMRSNEVRRLLTLSPGTLQNLRITGKLPYTKLGGVIYYHYEDIRKMLDAHKQVMPRK